MSHTSVSNEELYKEIDLIQAYINRNANNSFVVKGWLLSILAAILTLLFDEINNFIVVITLILVIVTFWSLDAFFVRNERLYLKLYDWVLEERKKGNREHQYSLKPLRFNNEVESIGKVMVSKTLIWFYGIIIVLISIVEIYYLWPQVLDLLCSCR